MAKHTPEPTYSRLEDILGNAGLQSLNAVPEGHQAGFVNIIGKPNAGKSTLMNALVGEKLAIATHKAQTTRHRIIGIHNGPAFQIVYSDTPGILRPRYGLHKSMMDEVAGALQDADVLIYLADITEPEPFEEETIASIQRSKAPKLFVVNKSDLSTQEDLIAYSEKFKETIEPVDTLFVSALHNYNLDKLHERILELLPISPPFYGKEEVTDRSERFLVSELIREKIFLMYRQEIPYSTEVITSSFKDEKDILKIEADIIVERDTQKGILIGHQGEMLKKVGVATRKELEAHYAKQVYLGLHVRVKENWRDDAVILKQMGYNRK